jgi:hypothetical protein
MRASETIEYINKKFGVIVSEDFPLKLYANRFGDIPKLFEELGFETGAEVGVLRAQYSTILLNGCSTLKGIPQRHVWGRL